MKLDWKEVFWAWHQKFARSNPPMGNAQKAQEVAEERGEGASVNKGGGGGHSKRGSATRERATGARWESEKEATRRLEFDGERGSREHIVIVVDQS